MGDGAFVLAGGGIAGIAWEIGLLLGIEETEPAASAHLRHERTTFVGTSAGSVVASQVAGGVSLRQLFDQQLEQHSAEVGARFDVEEFQQTLAQLSAFGTNPLDPATSGGSARAGREQERLIAAEVAAFLG